MEEENVKVNEIPSYPKNVFVDARIDRFGKIFFHMTLACLITMLVLFSSTIIGPMLYTVVLVFLFAAAIAMSIFTLGLIYLDANNTMGKVWEFIGKVGDAGASMQTILEICFEAIKWFTVVCIVASVAGIVFTSLTKGKSKVGKIVFLSIGIVVSIVVLALYIIGGIAYE